MSLIRCPKCEQDGFTWSVDDEVSPLTMWNCSLCGYHAEEDESKEMACCNCGQKGAMLLDDGAECYRYCDVCASKDTEGADD